jgi:DNA ligase-1
MSKPFRELAQLCEKLEKTASRKEKVEAVASFLKSFNDPDEASKAAQLLVGLHTGTRRKGLNVGPSTLYKALATVQTPLIQPNPLTVNEVWDALEKIRKLTGERSTLMRRQMLSGLFAKADEAEREWLVKVVMGEMRHGVNLGLLLEALATLASTPLEKIRAADMLLGNIGLLVKTVLENRLEEVGLNLFKPVKPMLAEFAYSPAEVLKKLGRPVICEPKIDGVRVQVHKKGLKVRVYSRGLRDLTPSVPDIVEAVANGVHASEIILDGEVYGVGADGRPLPFQETMRRVGREKDVMRALAEARLEVRFFDILYCEGVDVWMQPLSDRRQRLIMYVHGDLLVPAHTVSAEAEVERLLKTWLEAGYEGLMAKAPGSGYTPGRRGGFWLKLKQADTLDVVVVAAEWGHGRRSGWLSNYLLAVKDEEGGGYAPVGKTFKGLTDDEFRWMTEKLLSIKTAEHDWGVEVRPEVVLEVEYDEVQKSPHYSSGYALRFARVKRIRADKQADEIDTLSKVRHAFMKSRRISPG